MSKKAPGLNPRGIKEAAQRKDMIDGLLKQLLLQVLDDKSNYL